MPKDMNDFAEVSAAITEVKQLFEQLKESNEVKLNEAVKGVIDPLLTEKLGKINDEMTKKQKLIDDLYAAQKKKSVFLDGKQVDPAEMDAKAFDWAKMAAKRRGTDLNEYGHEDMLGYKTAFNSFLRKEERTLSGDEVKALSVGVDPDGGYLVTPDTSGRIVQRQFETSPMRQFASVQIISSDALEGLGDYDEAGAGWVGETEARAETTTPQLQVWRIPVHELYAKPKATQKLLDDASVDVEAWLARKVADRFSRLENAAFVNGNGVAKPRGFLSYPAGTTLPGQIERVKTGVSGAFAATPDGADVLIRATVAMKDAYRAGAVWAMNRRVQGAVRLLKNSDGDYLWQPSIVAGQPSTLLGYGVAGFEDMPDIQAGSLSIAFANFSEGYQIVDRLGIRVLRDPYSAKPFVEFYSTKRVGGDVLNFEAIKLVEFLN